MTVNPIPENYHTVTPYVLVEGAQQLIDFLEQAFGAQPGEKMMNPQGGIMHAEVRIGDSAIMLGDANEQNSATRSMFHLYLGETDRYYQQALAAGATSLQEPKDEFYGDRTAGVQDPFGNQWWIATHVEELSPEELQRRAAALQG
jgi:PhnB protein